MTADCWDKVYKALKFAYLAFLNDDCEQSKQSCFTLMLNKTNMLKKMFPLYLYDPDFGMSLFVLEAFCDDRIILWDGFAKFCCFFSDSKKNET